MSKRDVPKPTGPRVRVEHHCPGPTEGELIHEVRDTITGELRSFTVRLHRPDTHPRSLPGSVMQYELEFSPAHRDNMPEFFGSSWSFERLGAWTPETIEAWQAGTR